jgi:antitoxin VapB
MGLDMKRSSSRGRSKLAGRGAMPKSIGAPATKRASIFRNGSNQAVRLPQELKFPENVKEVRIRKQGDALLLSPVRPDWSSFFALQVEVPDDFLAERSDRPPQSRDPL